MVNIMEKIENKRLKELLKIDPQNLNPRERDEFFDELMKSSLFLPVKITSNGFNDDVKVGESTTTKEPLGFKPLTFTDEVGEHLFVFTDNEEIENENVKTDMVIMAASDIARNFQYANYYDIVINPFSKKYLSLKFESFLNLFFNDLFGESDLKDFFIDAKPLEENIAVFLREDEPLMKEKAINGIYSMDLPFKASSNRNFNKESKYLNILLLEKGVRMVYVGGIVDPETNYDILLAPQTEFKFIRNEDENTFLWICVNQKFYDD